MSEPGVQHIRHYQGDTLEQPIRLRYANANGTAGTPADLTGWTVTALARNARTLVPVPGLTATLGNQVTDPGLITLEATAEVTADWPQGSSLVYDVQITETASGFVRTVLSGTIRVVAQVAS